MENSVEELRMRVLGVIPARLASTRLPRKVLREIAGRPLLAWVYEAAQRCAELERVVVATDADEVMELCLREGWPCEMTSNELQSGTDRLHAVAQRIPAEIYVNIQGDEPMLRPEHVTALLRPFANAPGGCDDAEGAVFGRERTQSERGKGSDGGGWAGAVFFAGDDSV